MSWDERWAERVASEGEAAEGRPEAWIVERAHLLPARGRAIDVAGGLGRHTRWMASLGLEVTLCDASATALAAATDAGVPAAMLPRDLVSLGPPPGPWDVALSHHFLDLAVLDALVEDLTVGGVLVFAQPTVRNLERNPRPGRRFLLAEDEMDNRIARWPVEVLYHEQDWFDEGRHECRLVARRRPHDPTAIRSA